jgi:multiple sugar transport system substrate-binding protein
VVTAVPKASGELSHFMLAGVATVGAEWARKFEQANPQIKVKDEYLPFGQYETKLRMLFAAGTPPDAFWYYFNNTVEFTDNDLVLSIDDLIARDGFAIKDFADISVKMFTHAGKLYGVPREATSLALAWSKKAFDDAKVDPPNESWTMDTFLEAAKKLTVDSRDPTQRRFGVWVPTSGFVETIPWVWSLGGDLVSADRKAATVTADATVKGFQWVADLINVHKVAPPPGMLAGQDGVQLFLRGQIAMQVIGRWVVAAWRKSMEALPGTDFDVVLIPKGPAGRFTRISAASYAIGKKAKNIEAGWAFIKFMSSREVTEDLLVRTGMAPAYQPVAKSDVFLEPGQSPANMKAFVDALAFGRAEPVFARYAELSNLVAAALDLVYTGQQSAAEAMAGIKAKADALFSA